MDANFIRYRVHANHTTVDLSKNVILPTTAAVDTVGMSSLTESQ